MSIGTPAPAPDPAVSDGFWSGPVPWWAALAVGLLAATTAVFVMVRNNRAAAERDLAKRLGDDRRADRAVAAEVHSKCDECIRTYRRYYETWQASLEPENYVPSEVVTTLRNAAMASAKVLTDELIRAKAIQNSAELIAMSDKISAELGTLMEKIDKYERGTAIRLPLPGSTDLLFAGMVGALRNYVQTARYVNHG